MAAVTNRLLLRSVLERICLRGRNLRNMLIVDTNSRIALPVWSLHTHAARIAAMCEEQVRNSQRHIERGFARIMSPDPIFQTQQARAEKERLCRARFLQQAAREVFRV